MGNNTTILSFLPKIQNSLLDNIVSRLSNVLPNFKQLTTMPTLKSGIRRIPKDMGVVILSDYGNGDERKFLKSSINDTVLFEEFLYAASENKISKSQALTIFYKIDLAEGIWHFRFMRKGMRYDYCDFWVDFKASDGNNNIKILNSKSINIYIAERGLESAKLNMKFFVKNLLAKDESELMTKQSSEDFISEMATMVKAAPGIRDESSERLEFALKRNALTRFIYSGTALRTLSRDEQSLIDSYTNGNAEEKNEILRSLNLSIKIS